MPARTRRRARRWRRSRTRPPFALAGRSETKGAPPRPRALPRSPDKPRSRGADPGPRGRASVAPRDTEEGNAEALPAGSRLAFRFRCRRPGHGGIGPSQRKGSARSFTLGPGSAVRCAHLVRETGGPGLRGTLIRGHRRVPRTSRARAALIRGPGAGRASLPVTPKRATPKRFPLGPGSPSAFAAGVRDTGTSALPRGRERPAIAACRRPRRRCGPWSSG